MRTVHGLTLAPCEGPTAVAIGTFDGVHLGHQALIRSAVQQAHTGLIRSAVLTFDRHPLETLDPRRAPLLLDTPDQRQRHIAALGVDLLLIAPFDDAMRSMEAEDFVTQVLVRGMAASTVHVGQGFVFGRGRRGDADLLRTLGRRMGFTVNVVPAVLVGGFPASSSRARTALEAGDVEGVASLLGRPFELAGTVVAGDRIGRELGYPTANLRCAVRQATPADGVYATTVHLDGVVYAGACSIGTRPSMGGTHRVIEVHLIGFAGDLYGRVIEVAFLRRLRDQQRYDSRDALTAQIARDVQDIARIVASS